MTWLSCFSESPKDGQYVLVSFNTVLLYCFFSKKFGYRFMSSHNMKCDVLVMHVLNLEVGQIISPQYFFSIPSPPNQIKSLNIKKIRELKNE